MGLAVSRRALGESTLAWPATVSVADVQMATVFDTVKPVQSTVTEHLRRAVDTVIAWQNLPGSVAARIRRPFHARIDHAEPSFECQTATVNLSVSSLSWDLLAASSPSDAQPAVDNRVGVIRNQPATFNHVRQIGNSSCRPFAAAAASTASVQTPAIGCHELGTASRAVDERCTLESGVVVSRQRVGHLGRTSDNEDQATLRA